MPDSNPKVELLRSCKGLRPHYDDLLEELALALEAGVAREWGDNNLHRTTEVWLMFMDLAQCLRDSNTTSNSPPEDS